MKLKFDQWLTRKAKLATDDQTPTMTDQSGAEDTDVNVIVKRYGVYGTMPQGTANPQYGQDLSEIPTDLATAIETVRGLEALKNKLPEGLKKLTIDQLMTYTPEAITRLAQPETKPEHKAETKPEQKQETKKEESKT